jgi:hypothetical protein
MIPLFFDDEDDSTPIKKITPGTIPIDRKQSSDNNIADDTWKQVFSPVPTSSDVQPEPEPSVKQDLVESAICLSEHDLDEESPVKAPASQPDPMVNQILAQVLVDRSVSCDVEDNK